MEDVHPVPRELIQQDSSIPIFLCMVTIPVRLQMMSSI